MYVCRLVETHMVLQFPTVSYVGFKPRALRATHTDCASTVGHCDACVMHVRSPLLAGVANPKALAKPTIIDEASEANVPANFP